MIDFDFFRARLIERRAELMKRLEQLEDWLDEAPDPDVEERATEREFGEVFEAQDLPGRTR